MKLYEKAVIFAVQAHHGQTRWNASQPYVIHPLRVAQSLESEQEKAAAVLHDVMEDRGIDRETLSEFFGDAVAEMVEIVSRRTSETYRDFIGRIIASGNRSAMRIKLADVSDNLVDLPTDHGLRKRYLKARLALINALAGRKRKDDLA